MVYTMIEVVRGIIVDRLELIEFILADPQYRDRYSEDLTSQELLEKDDDFWSALSEEPFIWTWPCCSPLQYKRFLLGFVVCKLDPDEIMNKPFGIPSEEVAAAEEKIRDRLREWRKEIPSDDFKTLFMLDDCAHCS